MLHLEDMTKLLAFILSAAFLVALAASGTVAMPVPAERNNHSAHHESGHDETVRLRHAGHEQDGDQKACLLACFACTITTVRVAGSTLVKAAIYPTGSVAYSAAETELSGGAVFPEPKPPRTNA